MIYVCEINLTKRFTTRNDITNNSYVKCKLYIFVDEVIKNLQEKKIFHLDIIKDKDQIYLHENIKNIEIYRGNLKNSDICFIEKN